MKLKSLKVPTITSITGRSSSIRASFIKAVIPVVFPANKSERELLINENLKKLKHTESGSKCAYCVENLATEWDHFFSIVNNKLPTGYITDIYNLVPCCGKCNQSKGSTYWKDWMNSNAPQSPFKRQINNLDIIIQNLDDFEKWSKENTYILAENQLKSLLNYMHDCELFLESLKKFQSEADFLKKKFLI